MSVTQKNKYHAKRKTCLNNSVWQTIFLHGHSRKSATSAVPGYRATWILTIFQNEKCVANRWENIREKVCVCKIFSLFCFLFLFFFLKFSRSSFFFNFQHLFKFSYCYNYMYTSCRVQVGWSHLRPSSDAVLHMSRIECKWEKSFVLPHWHLIRLMWSTASELGLSLSVWDRLDFGKKRLRGSLADSRGLLEL